MQERNHKKKEAMINQFIGQEQLLWCEKPSWKHMFKFEAQYISLYLFLFPLYYLLTMIAIHDGWVRILFLVFPYLFITLRIAAWLIRKYNTYFVLTDRRAVIIFRKDGKWTEINKPYKKIWHCDVQTYRSGCNIHIGKYRYNHSSPYNYETRKHDSICIELNERFVSNWLVHFHYTVDYFVFYDLDDCTIPAQIIRERMLSGMN